MRRARTAPIFVNRSLLRAGIKADRPNHRKNRTIAIVDQAIIHSPLVNLNVTAHSGNLLILNTLPRSGMRCVVQFMCGIFNNTRPAATTAVGFLCSYDLAFISS
jgi:hypothetical protein